MTIKFRDLGKGGIFKYGSFQDSPATAEGTMWKWAGTIS
jgi:hypothetical protein